MDAAAALKWIVISGIAVAIFFSVSAVFVDNFSKEAATLVTIVLGFFTTATTAILGAAAIQKSYDKAREEAEKDSDSP